MHSDRAAAVRDSINGCPDVVDDEALNERDGDPFETTSGGVERTITGDHVKPTRSRFRPAYIEEIGTMGNGEGAERPVFAVVLEPLWTEPDDVRSLSPDMVHEAAKHNVRIRFYPPEHRLGGAVWFVDHFQDIADGDSDRCAECESTYFRLVDGEAECARCGHRETTTDVEQTELTA